MIAEIRQHVKTQIRTCNAKYKSVDTPFFNNAEVVDDKTDYTYYLEFGDTTTLVDDTRGRVETINVKLQLYRQGRRDKLGDFDEGYAQALTINALILDKTKYISGNYTKHITSNAVTPAEISESQNIYSYTIDYNITISYAIGE